MSYLGRVFEDWWITNYEDQSFILIRQMRKNMERWPNFFIVGADKAGTSSLYSYLKDIPGIFMSSIKEPNYFSRKTIPDEHPILNPIRDQRKYLELFKDAKHEQIVGEASPSYLADPEAAELIHRISPASKILISLRDPVERIFSHYLMLKRNGLIKSSFYDEIHFALKKRDGDKLHLNHGLYFEHVKRYLDRFGEDQVKIIIFEEFVKNERLTVQNILRFLNLKINLHNFQPEIYNKYGVARGQLAAKILKNRFIRSTSEKLISPSKRRLLKEKLILKEDTKPIMDERERIILIDFYKNDVPKIENLLGRKLPWKNFHSHLYQ